VFTLRISDGHEEIHGKEVGRGGRLEGERDLNYLHIPRSGQIGRVKSRQGERKQFEFSECGCGGYYLGDFRVFLMPDSPDLPRCDIGLPITPDFKSSKEGRVVDRNQGNEKCQNDDWSGSGDSSQSG